jgi:hypothetical protein
VPISLASEAAFGAAAVQEELVSRELESPGEEPSQVSETRLRFEDAPAGAALEMMVVALPRELETRDLAGEVDGHYSALLDEGLDGAVDGRNTQTVFVRLSGAQDLVNGHRPIRAAKHAGNRPELPCISDSHRSAKTYHPERFLATG